MLIPYGTDAPIYHRPIATVSIIVINFAVFLMTGMGHVYGRFQSPYRWLIIEFDQINPLQWITGAFMHASWCHLVGNMIFLWCFGLVVEGKLGWRKFALVYLTLCLGKGAITQIPMFAMHGASYGSMSGCLGASGVIFGLIAIALCWAPKNDMHCLFTWTLWMPYPVDVPIFGLGILYAIMQILTLALVGFHMSTPMLHMLGMLVGFPVAIYMLKKNLVDCEGWDVLTLWGDLSLNPLKTLQGMTDDHQHPEPGRIGRQSKFSSDGHDAVHEILANPERFNPAPKNPAGKQTASIASISKQPVAKTMEPFNPVAAQQASQTRMRDRRLAAFAVLRKAISDGKLVEAQAAFEHIREHWGTHAINSKVLAAYGTLLSQHECHVESLVPLKVLVSRRVSCANQVCLRIARIQWQIQKDPEAAGATLSQIRQPIDKSTRLRQQQLANAIQQRDKSVATPSLPC